MALISTHDKTFQLQQGETLLAFVAPGEILPCCCRVTEDIKLDCRERIKEPDLFDVDLFEDK